MNASIPFDLIIADLFIAPRIWALGVLVVLGPFPVLATGISSNDEGAIQIVLTRETLQVDTVELCSLSELESALDARSRSTPVEVAATAESRTEILFKIREILITLDFDRVTFDSWGDTGWGLYPSSPDIDFHGCDRRESKDNVEAELGGERMEQSTSKPNGDSRNPSAEEFSE